MGHHLEDDFISVAFGNDPPEGGWPEPTEDEPSPEQLQAWITDSVVDATDGCQIEPDGVCEHGHPSWFLQLEII